MRELLRFLRALPRSVLMALVVYLPGEAGILLRQWYFRRRLRRCGRNLRIMPGVHIGGAQFIEIGDDVTIRENAILHAGVPAGVERREVIRLGADPDGSRGTIRIGDRSRIAFGAVLLGYGGIVIGERCGVGPYSVLLSETFHHKGKDAGRIYKYSQGADPEEQCVVQGLINMKDGAGVASNVIVLPGSTIAEDSWVVPHSVVRLAGFIERDVIAKGDPAAVVFRRRAGAQAEAG